MRKRLLFFVIFFASVSSACGQMPRNNAERIEDLHQNGVKISNADVIAWFPKDSLSESAMRTLIDSLALQIREARRFMSSPLGWQVFGTDPVTFYMSQGQFVANTSAEGYVIMPYWRLRAYKAPWLHEIMHVLLRSSRGNWNEAGQERTVANMPIWLTEGAPEYLAQRIAVANEFPKFDVHKGGGYLKIDSTCRASLRTEAGAYILPYIGRKGVLLELFGDKRAAYAPPFYNCSCSFTKYIAETYSLDVVLEGVAAFGEETETIERMTGSSIESLKAAWLAGLNR